MVKDKLGKRKSLTQQTFQDKNNRLIKGGILIIDINAIPRGFDVNRWGYILRTQGVCFYDSDHGDMPVITSPTTNIKIREYGGHE